MYAPERYRERRREVLASAIEDIRFATVIGCTPDGLEAVHVPLLAGAAADETWLDGHVSIGNPVVRLLADGSPVLAAFNGPHAYVSPSWMSETGISGRTAPTWAYVAVQVRGTIEWRTEPDWLRGHVAALSDAAERSIDSDWSTSLMPEDYAAALVTGIAGFRIRVHSMDGVWKVMQHSAPADREKMACALRAAGARQVAMANLIASGAKP